MNCADDLCDMMLADEHAKQKKQKEEMEFGRWTEMSVWEGDDDEGKEVRKKVFQSPADVRHRVYEEIKRKKEQKEKKERKEFAWKMLEHQGNIAEREEKMKAMGMNPREKYPHPETAVKVEWTQEDEEESWGFKKIKIDGVEYTLTPDGDILDGYTYIGSLNDEGNGIDFGEGGEKHHYDKKLK